MCGIGEWPEDDEGRVPGDTVGEGSEECGLEEYRVNDRGETCVDLVLCVLLLLLLLGLFEVPIGVFKL